MAFVSFDNFFKVSVVVKDIVIPPIRIHFIHRIITTICVRGDGWVFGGEGVGGGPAGGERVVEPYAEVEVFEVHRGWACAEALLLLAGVAVAVVCRT